MKILLAMTVTLALMPFACGVAQAGFTVTSIIQSGVANGADRTKSFSETTEGDFETTVRYDFDSEFGNAYEHVISTQETSVQVVGDTVMLFAQAYTEHSYWENAVHSREDQNAYGSSSIHFSIATPHRLELVDYRASTPYGQVYGEPNFGEANLRAISIPLEILPDDFRSGDERFSIWDQDGSPDEGRIPSINGYLSYIDTPNDSIALPPGEYQLTASVKSKPIFTAYFGSNQKYWGGGSARASFRLTAIVPEPSSAFLLVVGTSLLAARRSRE